MKANWTQERIAKCLGVAQQRVQEWLNGNDAGSGNVSRKRKSRDNTGGQRMKTRVRHAIVPPPLALRLVLVAMVRGAGHRGERSDVSVMSEVVKESLAVCNGNQGPTRRAE